MKKEKTIHLFTCGCGKADNLIHADFMKHLSEEHLLATKNLQAKREMKCHIDGSKWFSSTYEWRLENGLTFTEFYQTSRSKKDEMYR